jgi:hypothetical protein
MSTETLELLKICEALPAAKRTEVSDFARFLLDRCDDERWEQMVADPGFRPKLEAFAQQAESEAAEELDPRRL